MQHRESCVEELREVISGGTTDIYVLLEVTSSAFSRELFSERKFIVGWTSHFELLTVSL